MHTWAKYEKHLLDFYLRFKSDLIFFSNPYIWAYLTTIPNLSISPLPSNVYFKHPWCNLSLTLKYKKYFTSLKASICIIL